MPESSLHNVLRGHEPSVSRAARIASALGLELRIEPAETGPSRPPMGSSRPRKIPSGPDAGPDLDAAARSLAATAQALERIAGELAGVAAALRAAAGAPAAPEERRAGTGISGGEGGVDRRRRAGG